MAAANHPAIDIDGVTKRFGSVTALEDLSLTVETGEIYGFLGPNGAGKSTTIGIVLDLIRPTGGSTSVLGFDAQSESLQVRERLGFLSDEFEVYDRLTGRQHVTFAIAAKGAHDDPDELLERVGIADAAGRKAGGYSKGMKQRLGLATALVGATELLVLDEPSTGLDPNGAREMREIIREENERGTTVFFSSHILEQVEAVCDRVGILRNGSLVAEDAVDDLRSSVGGETRLRITLDRLPDDVVSAARGVDGVSAVTVDGEDLVVTCPQNVQRAVIGAVEDAGGTVEGFETEEASLEDVFTAYTEGEQ